MDSGAAVLGLRLFGQSLEIEGFGAVMDGFGSWINFKIAFNLLNKLLINYNNIISRPQPTQLRSDQPDPSPFPTLL